jgi:hypothetical protein
MSNAIAFDPRRLWCNGSTRGCGPPSSGSKPLSRPAKQVPLTRRGLCPHIGVVDQLQFHWLVGILEGEGTFLRGAPSNPGTPILRVSMTDRDVVEQVAKLLERAVVRLRRRRQHHKIPYATTIKGVPAVTLMNAVRPFLGQTRQLQIDRAITSLQFRKRPRHRVQKAISDSSALPTLMTRSDLSTTRGESREACDRAWIAGLLEGEGSFLINRGTASYPVLKVEMCEREVIARVADLLNTRVWVETSRAEGWRPTYVAQIAGHRAAMWMRELRPLMGIRRKIAIDAALAAYRPIRLTEVPRICVVEGCGRPHRSRGLCNTHYMSWSRDRAKGRTPRVTPLR